MKIESILPRVAVLLLLGCPSPDETPDLGTTCDEHVECAFDDADAVGEWTVVENCVTTIEYPAPPECPTMTHSYSVTIGGTMTINEDATFSRELVITLNGESNWPVDCMWPDATCADVAAAMDANDETTDIDYAHACTDDGAGGCNCTHDEGTLTDSATGEVNDAGNGPICISGDRMEILHDDTTAVDHDTVILLERK